MSLWLIPAFALGVAVGLFLFFAWGIVIMAGEIKGKIDGR